MPDWDIQPEGVQGVVDRTIEATERIEGWVADYTRHLQTASESAGTLAMAGQPTPTVGIIGAALGEFAEATQTDVQYIVVRSGASLTGAADATRAYVNGDLEMAQEAHAQALEDPELPPLTEPPLTNGDHEEPR